VELTSYVNELNFEVRCIEEARNSSSWKNGDGSEAKENSTQSTSVGKCIMINGITIIGLLISGTLEYPFRLPKVVIALTLE